MTNHQTPITIKKQVTTTPKTLPPNDKLGFGQFFTDHMLVAEYNKGQWSQPEIKPYSAFHLDPSASVLHYGQALFEGMKSFRRSDRSLCLFRPDYNHQRMNTGAERLCMPPVPSSIFIDGIKELVRTDERWVPNDPQCSLYLRPTLIGTEPFLGVRPSHQYLFFVIASPVGSYYGQGADRGVKIWVEEEFVRAAPGGLGATKAAANYANSLYASHRAKEKGFAQVLWLDVTHTYIEEVGTMNVFFVIGNKVVTPPLGGTILSGGVRDCVLQLLKDWGTEGWGMELEERPLSLQEVRSASSEGTLKEVFGCGTAAVITAVEELHTASGHNIILKEKGMGPIAQRLYETLHGIQRGSCEDKYRWTVPL